MDGHAQAWSGLPAPPTSPLPLPPEQSPPPPLPPEQSPLPLPPLKWRLTRLRLQLNGHQAMEGRQRGAAGGQQVRQLVAQSGAGGGGGGRAAFLSLCAAGLACG